MRNKILQVPNGEVHYVEVIFPTQISAEGFEHRLLLQMFRAGVEKFCAPRTRPNCFRTVPNKIQSHKIFLFSFIFFYSFASIFFISKSNCSFEVKLLPTLHFEFLSRVTKLFKDANFFCFCFCFYFFSKR